MEIPSLKKPFKSRAGRWSALALTLAAATAAPATQSEAQSQRDRVFTMQIQRFPMTAPRSRDARLVRVDCGQLASDGSLTRTFAEQFDIAPYYRSRPPRNEAENKAQLRGILSHLGGMQPLNHQIQVPWAEFYAGQSGAARIRARANPDLPVRARQRVNGRVIGLSRSLHDDRYNPVTAAGKMCRGEPLNTDIYYQRNNGDWYINARNLD